MPHELSENHKLNDLGIAELSKELRGALLQPGEAAYDEARSIWNGMIRRKPALIVRPSGSADVMACVTFARDNRIPLSIRGGGHNVAGTALCNGGLVIDMSRRRRVCVDGDRQVVRAEAGATWADVDQETLPLGLVVPGGIVSATGVAGFTMGGGFGWTSRRFGFAADNLISIEIVTADGQLRTASETENNDLFWAVRGGGGNFGAVTSFEFRAHRHGPEALCGMVVYPMANVRAVIDRYRQMTADAPEELTCLLILRLAPTAPFLPREVHGRPIAAIAVCWAGDPAAGENAVHPLKCFGQPLATTIAPKSFVEHQTMLDAGQPFGRRYYWKSHYFAEIREGLIDAMIEHAERIISPHSAVLLMHLGGAPSRLDPTTNAVGLRTAQYILNVQSAWDSPEEDDRHIGWARDYWVATAPFSTGGAYVNFMTGDEGEGRLRAAYGERVYERLRDIKSRLDAGNLFRGAQNIPPQ
jgi:FAD/FMN-containing dehydrogenase